MQVGIFCEGDFVDFIVVNSLEEFKVYVIYINGEVVVQNGKS